MSYYDPMYPPDLNFEKIWNKCFRVLNLPVAVKLVMKEKFLALADSDYNRDLLCEAFVLCAKFLAKDKAVRP